MRGKDGTNNGIPRTDVKEGVRGDDYSGVPAGQALSGPSIPKWSPGAKKTHPEPFMVQGKPARVKSGSATTHYRQGGMVTRHASGGWIKGATSNKGGLHRSLGVPEGEKIPASKIEKAEGSSNPKVRKQAVLAETLSRFRK